MNVLVTAHVATARAAGVLADTGLFQMANNAIAELQTLLFALAALVGVFIIIYVAAVTRFNIPKMLAAFIGAGLLLFAVHKITTSSGTVEKTVKELGGILNPPGLGGVIGRAASVALTHAAGLLVHLPLGGWF